ncbi:hypothetical protein HMPREF9136_0563 [Prevotella dentalis DSM 3688]|uniref:Uncharacterized protein n=1 Tax=Prevotella dentalis (strain ATCC 49559 / DSM 3688 / JCM 13448 / NCTC 12043 / ES 2772) TaxID=908937 RepID=F9D135_PREDD|nr:hypothetical protein HMPREF9136_0563 [Prevotella dentalis DSM 3688]
MFFGIPIRFLPKWRHALLCLPPFTYLCGQTTIYKTFTEYMKKATK